MVVGKPYIRFKINNEPIDEVIDYNYTWATTVEAQKGPINTPVYISSAPQAQAIFGIDMRPYFAQNPKSLIMVRVAGESDLDAPRKGKFSFNTESEITIYRAEQLVLTSKKVTKTGRKKNGQYISTHDDDNDIDVYEHKVTNYEHKMFYTIDEETGDVIPLVQHRDETGLLIPDSYIDSWTSDGRIITEEAAQLASGQDVTKEVDGQTKTIPGKKPHTKENLIEGDGLKDNEFDPEDYQQDLVASKIYKENVNTLFVPNTYIIPAGASLFEIESKYEGAYDTLITCGIDPSDITGGNGYRFVIRQGDINSLIIRNATDIDKIINRINDADLDVVAKPTIYGQRLSMAMSSYPVWVEVIENEIDNFKDNVIKTSIDTFNAEGERQLHTGSYDIITSTIAENTFIGLAEEENTIIDPITNEATVEKIPHYLRKEYLDDIENFNNGDTAIEPNIKPIDYKINLKIGAEQPLVGGSKGPWNSARNRIEEQYQAAAHAAGLQTLQRIRLAGVFCMYGEELIQNEYLEHGNNSLHPEQGMNNNETCKWRTILLGANENNRSDILSLINKAKSLNNQYVLFLGQGLIDTGMTGVVATLSETEKRHKIKAVNDNHLLPYECTQYIAGLRSKLSYMESIFGGQGRKRIRSVGDLEIAPLTSYDSEYYWDPINYTKLNEGGVLTFTEDYGNITLTDGVTTASGNHNEEDEEGVMNILKYAQNAIYDVCLPYIGRNIDADLENSITTGIEKVLEEMKTTDQSLIDTDEYPAYTVTVSLGSRRNQLLGRIYVYCTICPVHAVRQIEVEMTVQ